MLKKKMLYIVLFIIMPLGEALRFYFKKRSGGLSYSILQGAVPDTFFWKPRTGHDLVVPNTEKMRPVNIDNVEDGLATLLEAYKVGITVIGLAEGLSDASTYRHLNPISAYYYTNVYRWALRYFSLIPDWLGGAGKFSDTNKVWTRRFHYVDQFVPQPLRKALFFVKEDEWKKEEIDFKRFRKFAALEFGKHFNKEQTNETFIADVSSSSLSIRN